MPCICVRINKLYHTVPCSLLCVFRRVNNVNSGLRSAKPFGVQQAMQAKAHWDAWVTLLENGEVTHTTVLPLLATAPDLLKQCARDQSGNNPAQNFAAAAYMAGLKRNMQVSIAHVVQCSICTTCSHS
jgi:hypothetical protein